MPKTILSACLRCGNPLPPPERLGQPRQYCGNKCKAGYRPARREKTCLVCREPFVGNAHARFCSRACQFRHRVETTCPNCKGTFLATRGTKYCSDGCRRAGRPEVDGTCKECGVRFTRLASGLQAGWCSKACSDRCSKRRRRAIKNRAFVEEVLLAILLIRDGKLCRICLKPVDLSLKMPDPGSPTIDHIVPITRGGEHSYANAQLAHLGCNSAKCDRYPDIDGQLLLIPI